MKLSASFFVIFFVAVAVVSAQSGRVKPEGTPSPTPVVRGGSYTPTSTTPSVQPSTSRPRTTPTPDGDEVIKVDSVLVPVAVSVTDAQGNAVRTLKASDFLLSVDDKAVEFGDVFHSNTPIRLAMLFDNSSSVMIARDFEKEAAVRFFKRVVRPDVDTAALFSVADTIRLEQPLTANVGQLIRAVDLFPEPKGATALLDGIVQVADYLRGVNGRRVIVIVSDGEDTYSDLATTLESVVKTLQVSDCQVYVVKTKDFENYKRTGVRGGNANIRALTAERRMNEIAAQTGGEVYSPIDEQEMKNAFDRISAELAEQYIISYYPDRETEHAGDFRSITVSVKGRKDLVLRARKGYYVPK